MGGDEAEGSAPALMHVSSSGLRGPEDDAHGFVPRRDRRARGHEFWSARPWPVREEERERAPRPAPAPAPIPVAVSPAGPHERTAAGLPRRIAPGGSATATAPAWSPPSREVPVGDVSPIAVEASAAPTPAPVAPQAPLSPVSVPAPAAAPPADPVSDADPVPDAAQPPSGDALEDAISMLVAVVPHLDCLATDADPDARATYARCHALVARLDRAVSDRRVWRRLLTMADSDVDPTVRAEADGALVALETHGTRPRAA